MFDELRNLSVAAARMRLCRAVKLSASDGGDGGGGGGWGGARAELFLSDQTTTSLSQICFWVQ